MPRGSLRLACHRWAMCQPCVSSDMGIEADDALEMAEQMEGLAERRASTATPQRDYAGGYAPSTKSGDAAAGLIHSRVCTRTSVSYV